MLITITSLINTIEHGDHHYIIMGLFLTSLIDTIEYDDHQGV